MKKSSIKLLLLSAIFIIIIEGLSYVLLGQKWPIGTVIHYYINANTNQVTNESYAVKSAANSWSQIFPAGLRLSFVGSTSATTHGYNGLNTICWKNEGNADALATAYLWYWTSNNIIFEADMVFNDYYPWSTSGSNYDIETIALHEFGHWVGLDHSSTGIMYPYYSGIQRSIDSDARAGFLALYWLGKDQLPSVSITSPQNGDFVKKTITIKANASDDKGVTKVEFYIDNVLKGTDASPPYERNWDTTKYTSGAHNIKARAYDTINQTAEHTIQVTVDQPPTISITSPSSGSNVYGIVTVKTSVSDDFGINKVQFYVNGGLSKTSKESPHIFNWETNKIPNGKYTIEAVVYDTRNQTAQDIINLIRIPHAPLNFSGTKQNNSSVLLEEYVNALSWQSNDLNTSVGKYRIYQKEGKDWVLLVELNANTFKYWHRNVSKDEKYVYTIKAVDSQNIEGEATYLEVQ